MCIGKEQKIINLLSLEGCHCSKWGMIIQRPEAKKIINTINNVCYSFPQEFHILDASSSSSSSALSEIFPWNWARSCKFQDFRRRLFIHNWLIELSGLFKWIFPATTADRERALFLEITHSLFIFRKVFFYVYI